MMMVGKKGSKGRNRRRFKLCNVAVGYCAQGENVHVAYAGACRD